MPTDPINQLWQRLTAITSFRYLARPGTGSQTGWTGEAQGTVEVIADASASTLDFVEQGTFETSPAKAITIRNTYRWELIPGTVRVAHLRFSTPVRLVDLIAVGNNSFRSKTPHLCGEDRYRLSLEMNEEELAAHWTIQGPRKDENLRYSYRSRPFPGLRNAVCPPA